MIYGMSSLLVLSMIGQVILRITLQMVCIEFKAMMVSDAPNVLRGRLQSLAALVITLATIFSNSFACVMASLVNIHTAAVSGFVMGGVTALLFWLIVRRRQ
jgi:hypothetical protein